MRWSYYVLMALALWLALPCAAQAAKKAKFQGQIHVVKRGETLSEIAQRYQVSVAQVRQWNKLRNNRIRAGQRLKIARLPEWHLVKKGDTLAKIARAYGLGADHLRQVNRLENDRLAAGQKIRVAAPADADTTPAAPAPAPVSLEAAEEDTLLQSPAAEEAGPPLEYTVQPGDSLGEIARRFEVSLNLLRQLNRLKKDRIHPGQKLQLRPSPLEEGIHVVRPGDTLTGIARRYRLSLEQLREINGIESSKILIGQKLRLKPTPTGVHIVERGDALWEIASAYGMDAEELKRLNDLETDQIYPGQELKLSAQRAETLALYTVERGDNLSEIARLHQMSVSELKKLNKLTGSVIHPGTRLKVKPLLGSGAEAPQAAAASWDGFHFSLEGIDELAAENGPYYHQRPGAERQPHASYYENPPLSPLRTYEQARGLWQAFSRAVDRLSPLSKALAGWHVALDPGHGGLDPGAVVQVLDGNGNKLYVVEDEYVYDIALRVYVLVRLHGADASMTLLSPNHLIRHSNPATQTFVNEKNEVYNSRELNAVDDPQAWPRGGRGGNLNSRVRIAQREFGNTPQHRRIFLSFHADIDPNSPEAPLVLYYEGRQGRDTPSRNFARALLPALGAGAHLRGQPLGVLRNNPAGVKVLLELRNLAYTDHGWALRFEQLRHRDAEKVVKGLLEYVRRQNLSARQ